MKRFIMIFVSFCILIMICSCHQSLPELPNGGDTTVVNDPDAQETTGLPTQEGQAEETTERMVETEPVIGGDMPIRAKSSVFRWEISHPLFSSPEKDP